jgi:hypothetical protein
LSLGPVVMEARRKAGFNRVGSAIGNDRNRGRGVLCCTRCGIADRHDWIDPAFHQLLCELRESLRLVVGRAAFDQEVATN